MIHNRLPVRRWVKDLVLTKKYSGLKLQDSILKRISEALGKSYRAAKPEEEAKGIDGFIGDIPVSIKPITIRKKCYQKT